MSPTEDIGEKVTPHRNPITSMSPATVLAVLIIIVQILISIVTYPFMPNSVPSHWDASGQVNGYLPKLVKRRLFRQQIYLEYDNKFPLVSRLSQ